MDDARFDALARWLTTPGSRRRLLTAALGGTPGLLGLAHPDDAAAKKGKKKPKRPKPNAFGCLSVGAACKKEGQCCSGMCAGKKGKRTCRAHSAGTCDQSAPGVCTATNPVATKCNNNSQCLCFRTTADSRVCGEAFGAAGRSECSGCTKDADCLELGFPPGTACAPLSVGICAGTCESGMACIVPCGAEPFDPAGG